MQRPTSVTVFGVLNLVFGVFGVFGLIASAAIFALPLSANNPVVKIVHENPGYAAFLKLSIAVGVLALGALVAAGIGLLLLKAWARILSIIYAIYAMIAGLIGVVLNFVYVMRPLLQQASQQHGPEAAGAIGGAIGGTVGGCVGLIYPVLLLIFMTRPKVIAAFQATANPQVRAFPPA